MQGKFYEAFAEAFHAEAAEVGLVVHRFDSVTFYNLAFDSTQTSTSPEHAFAPTTSPGRRSAPSAPGAPTSRASGSFFVPAASPNAHNTFLHPNRAAPKRNTSDRRAASAPGVSPSRAGPSTFIRAAQANAHNPFLQSTNSSAHATFVRASEANAQNPFLPVLHEFGHGRPLQTQAVEGDGAQGTPDV